MLYCSDCAEATGMRFRLIVFDWDGTLMDSEAKIVACIRAASTDLGIDPPADAASRNIIGLGLKEAVDMLFPGTGETFRLQLEERYRHHFLYANRTPSPLFPGTTETLASLEAAGYLLGVATGKSRRGLRRALEETGLVGCFHASRCADETFSKPHPAMLLEVMEELGAEPTETLMIGDTEYDMQMARNAGTAALGVSYGVHDRARLLRHRTLGCLDDIQQLPFFLERMQSGSVRFS